MTTIKSNEDLLGFLVSQANSGAKNWFGFQQQRIAGIDLAYKIAEHHADKLTPKEITTFVKELNNCVYVDLIASK